MWPPPDMPKRSAADVRRASGDAGRHVLVSPAAVPTAPAPARQRHRAARFCATIPAPAPGVPRILPTGFPDHACAGYHLSPVLRTTLNGPHHPHALPPHIRRDRRRWRPCRHGGGAGRGAGRGADAAAHPEHRDAGADELQPGHRRDRQGAPRQGDRRPRRGDGAGRGPLRDPLPHPERAQGSRGAGDPRPDRPLAVSPPHARGARTRAPAHAAPADRLRSPRGRGRGARGW